MVSPAYTVTNFNTVLDSTTYKSQIDANSAVLQTLGAWFAPQPNSPAAMNVQVNAGALFVSGAVAAQALQTTGTITAPSGSNKRIDRVVINAATGAISVITGTPTTGTPAAPAITAGNLPCCQVGPLLSSTTAIGASLISDERAVSASSKFAQVVNTEIGAVASGSTTMPISDSIPTNTQGDQYMSLAITPTNASSTLLIDVVANFSFSVNDSVALALFQDSTSAALAATQVQVATEAGRYVPVFFRHKMTAGTTSATTFKLRIGGNSAGTITFNGISGARNFGGVFASSMTITEVSP